MKYKRFLLAAIALFLGFVWAVPAYADGIILSKTVQASQTAEYSVELHNDTTSEHTYSLSVSGLPDMIAVRFTQGGPLLQEIRVPAQGYAQVFIRVDVPADTPVGRYEGQFVATRDDGIVLDIPMSLNVENTYALQIVSLPLNQNVFSGQDFSFDVTVLNSGAATVTHLALKPDAPPKWIVTVEPSVVDTLAPGDQMVFHVKVMVPASQSPGDETFKMSLSSEQTATPASTMTVRVQKSPTLFFAALGLMALAVVGVFLYFRVQGRR